MRVSGTTSTTPLRRSSRHIPGAWFLTRARLEQDALNLPEGDLVIIADDMAYAHLIARDLGKLGRKSHLLDGGMTAWKAQNEAIP